MKKKTKIIIIVISLLCLILAVPPIINLINDKKHNNQDIEVLVYINNEWVDTLTTNSSKEYKITPPNDFEDITTNPNLNKYFYGWFTDSNYKNKLTDDTTFEAHYATYAIYAKWIEVYNDRFVYNVEDNKATIIGFSNSGLSSNFDLVIPGYINQIPVETIASSAFSNYSIKTLIICEGIKNIESLCFFDNSSLCDIYLPKSLNQVSTSSFKSCNYIERIVINSENTTYGSPNNCNAIIELDTNTLILGCQNTTIPDFVTEISACAFEKCPISEINLPNGITKISNSAFNGCSALSSITIPDSVTTIGDSAFNGCKRLSGITIPANTTNIGEFAFKDCNLETIAVNENNEIYSSPNNCNAIIKKSTNTLILGCKNTIIPDSVTSISGYAFYNCEGLINITIPNSITSIGTNVFTGCTSLSQISIPFTGNGSDITYFGYLFGVTEPTSDSGYVYYLYSYNYNTGIPSSLIKVMLTGGSKIEDNAFKKCYNLKSIMLQTDITTIGDYAFYGCSSLSTISIPSSVTTIGNSAFSGCTSFTSITIPSSVTSIGSSAFSYCNLETIYVDENNEIYSSPNNCNAIIEKSTNTLISGCKNTIIPDSVTKIGSSAFSGCTSFTSITIPNSITSIGSSAFYGCTGLKSIVIPISVNIIGGGAFFTQSNTSVYCEAAGRKSGWEDQWLHPWIYMNETHTLPTVYWYSESQPEPTTVLNYWHYGENNEILIWEFS